MNLDSSSDTSKSSDLRLLKALKSELFRRKSQNRLSDYVPYPKQAAFHEAGKLYRERAFMAGNQLGKTMSGAAEAAIHLTGRYPRDWNGRVFDGPIRALAGSESSELTRDGVQRVLVGDPRNELAWGQAMIPKDALVDWSRKPGVPDSLDGVVVKWGGGGDVQAGRSALNFKSFDQGRTKWQADTLNFVWFDEEPPLDVYSEGLTRTSATGGMVFGTFTPLLGMSEVVRRFLMERSPDRVCIQMTIDDALHFTPEQRAIVTGVLCLFHGRVGSRSVSGSPFVGARLGRRIMRTPLGSRLCANSVRSFAVDGMHDPGGDRPGEHVAPGASM
jgi:phage terminase large subunit-like protein